MKLLDSMSPDELTLITTIIAISIAKGQTASDLNVLGNFLTSLAAQILAIASQEENLNTKEEKRKQIVDLQNQIDTLKKDLE